MTSAPFNVRMWRPVFLRFATHPLLQHPQQQAEALVSHRRCFLDSAQQPLSEGLKGPQALLDLNAELSGLRCGFGGEPLLSRRLGPPAWVTARAGPGLDIELRRHSRVTTRKRGPGQPPLQETPLHLWRAQHHGPRPREAASRAGLPTHPRKP